MSRVSSCFVLSLLLVALAFTPVARAADEGVEVPSLQGKAVDQALTLLETAGLTARVVEVAGPEVGVVDAQDPAPGFHVPAGSEIVLIVGTAVRVPTKVPNVVGRGLDGVIEELESVYFLEVTFEDGPAAKAGQVVRQKPEAGASLLYRGVFELVVVRGDEPDEPGGVHVPSVIGGTEAQARQVLQALGLQVSVTKVADASAASGTVLSQDPPSGAELLSGSTVFLRVARAPAEAPGTDVEVVRVPLVVGLQMAEAEAAVLGAGLAPRPRYRTTDEFPPYTCIGQDPKARTEVEEGSTVYLVISRPAPEPEEVRVPTVIGSPVALAEEIVVAAGLRPRVETVPSSLPAGRVFEQDPPAGRSVPAGTEVRMAVAEAPEPDWTPQTSEVPELRGMPIHDALHILLQHRLQGRVRERPAPNQPVDVVEDQEPGPGHPLPAGAVVYLFVPEKAGVPDLIGHSRTSAIQLLQAAGLNPAPRGPRVGVGSTRVTSQDPPADAVVARGSTVGFYYVFRVGGGPVYGTVRVPNVVGLSRAEARATLEARGLRCACRGPTRGPSGSGTRVVRQGPAAGSLVRRGTAISVEYVLVVGPRPGPAPGPAPVPVPVPGPGPGPGPGAQMVRVPRVVGLPTAQAQSTLRARGLGSAATGAVVGPGRGYVQSQAPNPGVVVRRGTVVRIRIIRR